MPLKKHPSSIVRKTLNDPFDYVKEYFAMANVNSETIKIYTIYITRLKDERC